MLSKSGRKPSIEGMLILSCDLFAAMLHSSSTFEEVLEHISIVRLLGLVNLRMWPHRDQIRLPSLPSRNL